MASCPNCGNYWNVNDSENAAAADSGSRQPIDLVQFVNQQLDESTLKMRCHACSSTWTGTYKRGKLLEVDVWHVVNGIATNHK